MPAAIHCPEIGTVTVFLEGPLPLPCTWGRQLQRKRRGSKIQPLPAKRKRETLPEEGQCCQKATTVDFVNVYVAMSLHVMPAMQIFYPSTIVNQLKRTGIEPIPSSITNHSGQVHLERLCSPTVGSSIFWHQSKCYLCLIINTYNYPIY